jgi:ABC-type branched-subunit amino acid transport system substrate-binding protein
MAEQSHQPQARRFFLRLAAGAALSLALAGCSIIPVGGGRGEPPPAPPPPQPEDSEPINPNLPRGETRNRVAVLVPLTGPNAGVGTSISNAANLALADAQSERIRLTVYDTGTGAAAAAQQAITEGNALILGPLLADEALAVAPVARRAGVPVISFSNDIGVAGEGVYIMGFNPAQSIHRVVSYARSQGVQRFAGLIPEGDYGRRASAALAQAVDDAGARMVATETFGRTPQSLRSAAVRLNAEAPYDAVLVADNGRIAISAAATIRSGPSNKARILGTELWRSEPALTSSVPMRGAWFAAASENMFNQLRTRYRARFGKTPYRLASLGYDAVLLAVRIGNEWRIGRRFPEGELLNPEGFTGVDGAFRFGRNGVADRQLEVVQVNAGAFTTVSPAPRSFAR